MWPWRKHRLRTYDEAREELGGEPWKRAEGTESWFIKEPSNRFHMSATPPLAYAATELQIVKPPPLPASIAGELVTRGEIARTTAELPIADIPVLDSSAYCIERPFLTPAGWCVAIGMALAAAFVIAFGLPSAPKPKETHEQGPIATTGPVPPLGAEPDRRDYRSRSEAPGRIGPGRPNPGPRTHRRAPRIARGRT
jgi:hypothetical protein